MSTPLLEEVKRLLPFPPLTFLTTVEQAALLLYAENAESEIDLPNNFLLMMADARIEAEPPPSDIETGEEG